MFVTTNLISFANIRTCAQQAKACTEFAYQTFHSHLKLGKNGLPFSKMQKKKRLCRKALATFVVLLCPLAIASAQAPKEGQDVQLTVRSAIETARKSSPALNQIRAQIRGKKGQKWMSVGLRSPELLYFKEELKLTSPAASVKNALPYRNRSTFRCVPIFASNRSEMNRAPLNSNSKQKNWHWTLKLKNHIPLSPSSLK